MPAFPHGLAVILAVALLLAPLGAAPPAAAPAPPQSSSRRFVQVAALRVILPDPPPRAGAAAGPPSPASPPRATDSAPTDCALEVMHRARTAWTLEQARYPLSAELPGLLWRDFGELGPVVQRRLVQTFRGRVEVHGETLAALQQSLPYRVLPGVVMPLRVETKVAALAARFRRRTGRRLVVTSGTRDPRQQARAMVGKLRRRGRFLRLYRKRELAREVLTAFRRARRHGLSQVAAVERVLRAQIARGDYVSAHLRRGAVDLRSRNLSRRHKRALRRAADAMPELRLIREERRPPHFHLEVLEGWTGPTRAEGSAKRR